VALLYFFMIQGCLGRPENEIPPAGGEEGELPAGGILEGLEAAAGCYRSFRAVNLIQSGNIFV
jgi:hypothetical protein